VFGNTQFAAKASVFKGITKTDTPKNLIIGTTSTVSVKTGYSYTVKLVEKVCPSLFETSPSPVDECLTDEPHANTN